MAEIEPQGGRRRRRIVAATNTTLIEQEATRTGIAIDQLTLIVARSIVVRSLASNPDYRERLVLKGGTLLYHVYRSPRASFRDADFGADPNLRIEELHDALTVDEHGFTFNPVDGSWQRRRGILEGVDLPFMITDVRPLRRNNHLKMTVSVRRAEQLDPRPSEQWPHYEDMMLAGQNTFPVNALTLNELASEKFLGFALHSQPKHFIDLALIGRDHAREVDTDKVADLIERKFQSEHNSPDTRADFEANGLTSVSLIPGRFGAGARRTIETQWSVIRRNEVVFATGPGRRPGFDSFEAASQVFDEHWDPVLAHFRRHGR